MGRDDMPQLTALADELLFEWYNWASSYRPNLSIPGCDPACRNSVSSRQFDTTTDITRDICNKVEMEAVQYCYDALSFPYQNAIGVEMKNRQVKAKVWRASVLGKTYPEALEQIIPWMRKKDLL